MLAFLFGILYVMKANITKLQTMSILRGAAFYLPIVSLFFIDQGVAISAIVISQVFYAVFILIGNVPSGVFGDKFGHKHAILLGHGVSAIGYIGMAFIPGVFGLFVAYSFRGFGNSFIAGSDEALLYESAKEADGSAKNFKRYIGGYTANDVIGFAAATLIAGLALAKFGSASYVPLILVTALTEVVALLIGLSLKNSRNIVKQVKQKSSQLVRESLSLIRHNKTVFTLVLVPILTFSGEYFL